MYLDTHLIQGICKNLVTRAKGALDSANHPSSLFVSKNSIKRTLLALSLVPLLALNSPLVFAQDNDNLSSTEEDRVKNNPNLNYELELLSQHAQIASNYNNNYNSLKQVKQPANKSEKCDLSSDLLDPILSSNSMVFWEGSCKNDQADGFGRVYIITSGRIVFEMLANFNSDNNDLTTAYYTKNTKIDSRTIYFYGKSNRYQSSGILITQSRVDNDLLVGMQTVDKVKLITYQKETSKNSKYVLNIKDYGNFVHFIHDLIHTPYRSLSMSYRLTNRATNTNYGYNFTGQTDGSIIGNYVDQQNNSIQSAIPVDVLDHVMDLNREIDINVEGALKNVIESLPVIDAYKNVVCNDSYQNPTCTKMKCKDICNLNKEITPDDNEVKELLLRLVDHHNSKPLVAYLNKAKTFMGTGNLNPEYDAQDNLANSANKQAAINNPDQLQAAVNIDGSASSTIEQAYRFSPAQNYQGSDFNPAANPNSADALGTSALNQNAIREGGLSFGNQVNADSTVRSQLYEAKGPSLSYDHYSADGDVNLNEHPQIPKDTPNLAPNNLRANDPLSQAGKAQSQKELQAKIDKEKAIRQAQEAENKRRQEERRQEILERQRQGDQFNELPPPIDFSQVEEDPY